MHKSLRQGELSWLRVKTKVANYENKAKAIVLAAETRVIESLQYFLFGDRHDGNRTRK